MDNSLASKAPLSSAVCPVLPDPPTDNAMVWIRIVTVGLMRASFLRRLPAVRDDAFKPVHDGVLVVKPSTIAYRLNPLGLMKRAMAMTMIVMG